MADAEMDYQTSVAQDYELRRRSEWDAPSVQSIGKSRLIRPTRNAMDYAVRLLLRTPLPKLPRDRRVVAKFGALEAVESRTKYPQADQIAVLEQNVLVIARRIGLLDARLNPDSPPTSQRESLWGWFFVAQGIQEMFNGRWVGGQPIQIDEFPVGKLSVYISFKSGRPSSMAVRPACTSDALRYHAAQMVTSGTKPQACKCCKAPFLIGGPRARGKKKAGTRFCSEQCRWDYNNARRKKMTLYGQLGKPSSPGLPKHVFREDYIR
jgi:hypothetical protein